LLDPNSYSGTSYYRLKQIDFDGTFSYSPIRAVEGEDSDDGIVVFPNPTTNDLSIRFGKVDSDYVIVRIYAANGKLVTQRTYHLQPYQVLQLEGVKDLAPATYQMQLIFDDQTTQTKRFIKNRL